MDAVKFVNEWNRMCKYYSDSCKKCDMNSNGEGVMCIPLLRKDPEKAVSIVENWASNHPVKTRQSEFMKLFPNVILNECESIAICPRIVDANFGECEGAGCLKCEKEYWLAEVK